MREGRDCEGKYNLSYVKNLPIFIPGISHNRQKFKMKKQEKYLLKNKFEFLKLAYLITRYRIAGKKPPKELLEQAKIVRILANFSREELETILKC